MHFRLTRRIQLAVISLVVVSFFLVGSGTLYYIFHKYDLNKDKSISEKTGLLLAATEKEFGNDDHLPSFLSDEMRATLISLSGMSATDFNLFNPDGDLYFSS